MGGTSVFLDKNPEIISTKYLPDRFDNYKMLAQHRAHIMRELYKDSLDFRMIVGDNVLIYS